MTTRPKPPLPAYPREQSRLHELSKRPMTDEEEREAAELVEFLRLRIKEQNLRQEKAYSDFSDEECDENEQKRICR